MKDGVRHPLVYQINTRVVLAERGAQLRRTSGFDDLSDAFLDDIADKGFQWAWFLGVWQTGPIGREISRSDPKLRASFRHTLPDLREEDICGSPFAVHAYDAHQDFGGEPALRRLRARLAARKMKLMLDFVPNHTSLDHAWVHSHPEYYVHGSEDDLRREPQNYLRIGAGKRAVILARGRDPHFDGWPDTLQLNYRHAGFREAQLRQLASVADRCDGVRCDMAMLVQPEIFQRTWGDRALPSDGSPPRDAPFWPEAIAAARRRNREFLFVAEVYWDMEWELQKAGFDYTYDKQLYDRLCLGSAVPIREHLRANPDYQDHSLRFLENHDEPRAADAFSPPLHRAAAVITFLSRGMRFFHEGELEGRRAHVSMHLGRRPAEPPDLELQDFYARLLACLRRPEVHQGEWRLLNCRQAWPDNPTNDQFIASCWHDGERWLLAIVNYGGFQAQCYVSVPSRDLAGRQFMLCDLLSAVEYHREGDDLAGSGLYVDMPPWGYHVFDLRPRD